MSNEFNLQWDQTGEKLYETGVDRGVLYPQVDGAYPKGVAWNGLINFSESPSGAEPNDLYADNIKYLSLLSAEDYGFSIEAYSSPKEFDACDGTVEVVPGVSIGQQERVPFGFCCRTVVGNDVAKNNYGYKLHLIYGAMAQPSERGYGTINDSPEAITLSWECTTTPVAVPGFKPTACITLDSAKLKAANMDGTLEGLEKILYGFENTEPRLPLPEEIIEMFGGAAAAAVSEEE